MEEAMEGRRQVPRRNDHFHKQIDKEKFGREFRETTEAVAETEAEAEKRQWKAGGRPLEEMIILMKQIDKEKSVEN